MYSYNRQTIRHPYACADDPQSEEQEQSAALSVTRNNGTGNDYFSTPSQSSNCNPSTPTSAPPIPRHPPSLQPGRSTHNRRPPDLTSSWNFDTPSDRTPRNPHSPPPTAPLQPTNNSMLRSYQSYTAPSQKAAPPKPRHRASAPPVPPVIPPKIPLHHRSEGTNGSGPQAGPAADHAPPVPPLLPSPQTTRASFFPHDPGPLVSSPPPSEGSDVAVVASTALDPDEEQLAKRIQNLSVPGDTSLHEFVQSTTGSRQRTEEASTPQYVAHHPSEEANPMTNSPDTMSFPASTPLRPASLITLEAPLDLVAQLEADEAFARQLAADEEAAGQQYPNQEEDEAFARRLAEEEHREQQNAGASDPSCAKDYPASDLPNYYEVASSSVVSDESAQSSAGPHHSMSSSEVSSLDSTPQLSRSPSDPSSADEKRSKLITVAEKGPPSAGFNPSQFVDAELLAGVSLSFAAPVISQRLIAFNGPMPNIISLPYGRCPPLHVQAPTWRHLLKLLARLGATRIEPTVEAMAVNRGELKLRTVIQFVRTHHQSSDWRTVIWLTTDHPVPASLPGAYRYTNGDVNVLPFSYTLSNLPALLRDSADNHMSQAYTVPNTPNIPFPVLPMTFPNLAMYLQAVLDESRRHLGDSSSGVRKLAKMYDACYPPSPHEASLYPPETPNSVGGLFKRVIGRGNRNNKKSRGTNEDTFEFITPFRPDEWGT